MENFDLKKYLAEGKLLKEAETSWNELDWDFSDLDSVNFRDFEVDIDQFNQLFARAPNYMTPNRPLILSANLALFRLGLPPLIHYI
jgi:hypothetical protein